ncbi:MAG: iron-sulfur cluster assembly scaffold protein [Ignavibacteria bacterium]|nr:iron-sulfur cluster assembly scaffold protein [Ignavibacteria bacterium]
MNEIVELLKKSGYSDKAIKYYVDKVNVGDIKDCDTRFAYTGPCGDTMKIFLRIKDDLINDAKFQAIGCAGAFASGSALTEMINGKSLEQALKYNEMDIMNYLGEIPEQKIHCAILAVRTLEKTIKQYRGIQQT